MIWPALVVIALSILGDTLNILTKADGALSQAVRLTFLSFSIFAAWALFQ
jgi:hypothetical protein